MNENTLNKDSTTKPALDKVENEEKRVDKKEYPTYYIDLLKDPTFLRDDIEGQYEMVRRSFEQQIVKDYTQVPMLLPIPSTKYDAFGCPIQTPGELFGYSIQFVDMSIVYTKHQLNSLNVAKK
jgi:hypothetical protein